MIYLVVHFSQSPIYQSYFGKICFQDVNVKEETADDDKISDNRYAPTPGEDQRHVSIETDNQQVIEN